MKTIDPPAAGPGRLGPFRHRPFAVYWAGGFLSNLGTWLQAVAGSIFVYQLTGSALAVGILNFAGFLPILLFSMFGGVISDRHDRRSIVVRTHILSGLIAAGLAALTFGGAASAMHVVVVAFALNTSYAVAKPSIIAILPGLVPRGEVADAVGLNSLQFILGQVAGPLVAALVTATAGASWAFTINALTYLGPILAMVYLRRRGLGAREVNEPAIAGAPRGSDPAHTDGASASAYVREHRWVLGLLAGVLACSAPLELVRTLSPAIAVEGLGRPETDAGLIVAAQSVGSALALAVFIPFRRRGWSRATAVAGLALQGSGLVLTSTAGSLGPAAVGVGLVGFGFSLCFPVLTGTLQAELPDIVRGRVMAVHQMAHLGNRPFAALAVGSLAVVLGAQASLLGGLLLVPLGLVGIRRAWDLLGGRPRPDAAPGARPAEIG